MSNESTHVTFTLYTCRTMARSDTCGIRTHAGRSHRLSRPTPWPLGHSVNAAMKTEESQGGLQAAEGSACQPKTHEGLSLFWNPQSGTNLWKLSVTSSHPWCTAATPVGFKPTRGDPIGLAGRRLSRSAKVSLRGLTYTQLSANHAHPSPHAHDSMKDSSVPTSICFMLLLAWAFIVHVS